MLTHKYVCIYVLYLLHAENMLESVSLFLFPKRNDILHNTKYDFIFLHTHIILKFLSYVGGGK